MASPKSKPDIESVAESLLRQNPARAPDLVAAIHAVNPTGLGLPASVERRRYALKSRLQSRLVLDFFEELVVEPLPSEPGVVGLRYRPQDRDACHAVVAELAEDARAKVQLHLDTREAPTAGAPPGRVALPSRASKPAGDLLGEGRQALADFDYDTSRRCFEDALAAAEDSDAAAIALLELLVDHLAAWQEALDVEPRLSPEQLTPPARTLLAIAAAQLGDVEACLRLASESDSPRLAVAFTALASQALRRGDFIEAARLLAEARRVDATAPELLALEGELAQAKAAEREPAERELARLLSSGDEAAADEKARTLLQRWPESGLARRALRELEAQRRTARAASLARDAQAAYDAGDDAKALALWGEALLLGSAGLEEKLAAAATRLERRRSDERVDAAVTAFGVAPSDASLLRYLQLQPDERRRVRAATGAEALAWMETLRVDSAEREWPSDVAAALALQAAQRAGTASPASLLGLLRPHEGRLRRLDAGRTLLAGLEARLREATLDEARAQLVAARAALAAGDLQEAARLAQRHPASAPPELLEEAARLAQAARAGLESKRRGERFDGMMEAGAFLEALAVVREGELDESEGAAAWVERRGLLSQRLRAQLHVEVLSAPEGLAAPDFGVGQFSMETSLGLDETGESFFWATGLGRHLFVRRVSVKEQRVVEQVALTLPAPIEYPDVHLSGSTLWVSSAAGVALQLSTRTWDVLRWHGPVKLAESELLDDALLAPGGRFLWTCVRSRLNHEEALRVFDLERGRLHRELNREGITLRIVSTLAGARVGLSGFQREGRLFAVGGALERTLPKGVQEVVVAPRGDGLLAVARPEESETEDGEGAEDDGGLKVLHLSAAGGHGVLVEELDDSFNDGGLLVATSRQAGASFVGYAGQERSSWLVAYGGDEGAFHRLWRVPLPAGSVVAQDLQASGACLIVPLESGRLRCLPLSVHRPDVEGLVGVGNEPRLPRVSDEPPNCYTFLTKALSGVAKEVGRLKGADGRRALAEVLAQHQGSAEALSFLSTEFRSWHMAEEAAEVAQLASTRFPGHPAVQLDVAEAAAERRDWPAVLAELEPIAVTDLAVKPRAHLHHLRALAQYHLGRLAEAREDFALAELLPGVNCQLHGWTEWLDAIIHEAQPTESRAARLLALLRRADESLAAGRASEALELLDVPQVWGCLEVQLGARLAAAVLQREPARGGDARARFILAAFLWRLDARHALSLPLGPLAWSAERVAAVAERARRWLD